MEILEVHDGSTPRDESIRRCAYVITSGNLQSKILL